MVGAGGRSAITYLSSLGSAAQAAKTMDSLERVSQKARAYLARKSDPATFMAFSGVLDALDSQLGKVMDDETGPTRVSPTPDSSDAHASAQGHFQEACAESLAESKRELDQAPASTLEQTQAVCKMFTDAERSAREGTRLEREAIDAAYRTRLRTALGVAQTNLTTPGLSTARVLNTRVLDKRQSARINTGAVTPVVSPAPPFDVNTRPGIQSPVHLQGVTACRAVPPVLLLPAVTRPLLLVRLFAPWPL